MAVPPPRWNANWSVLWDHVAMRVPDAPAIVMGDLVRTYAELEARAARLAAALVGLGIGRGDKVGICSYNLPEYLETVYATFKLGAVPVNMNFRYNADELAHLLRTAAVRAVVHPTSLRDGVAGAVALLDEAIPRLEVRDDDSPADPRAIDYESVLVERWEPPAVDERSGIDELFMFTGGTTGRPKAVIWRHGDLVDAQLVTITQPLGLPMPATLEDLLGYVDRVADRAPTTLPIAPFMHATALFMAMDTLLVGGTVTLTGSARFEPTQTLALCVRERASQLVIAGNAIAVPLRDALDAASAAGTPFDLSSLRVILSSGMVWTDDVKADIRRHTDATLLDVLGSSEGGPYAYGFTRTAADLPTRIELAEGAAVLDEEGEPTPVGEVGMLAYRGPMPIGYFGDPERTASTYRLIDGVRWVSVGDWVRVVDERGTIEFLGRDSAVVNTGGEKVYPAEVEEALLEHPSVVDAAVFGVRDARWGQRVVAAVAADPASGVTEEALLSTVRGRLAGYKRPTRVVILPTLERSPSGKVDLGRLSALFDA